MTSPNDGTLTLDAALVRRLRVALLEGQRLPELVAILRPPGEAEPMSSLLVTNYFMKAFDLRFVQLRRLPGAPCMGGASYTDEEVDAFLRGSVDVSHVAQLLTQPDSGADRVAFA